MVIIVMGVSGCGKTTIGKKLAEHLQLPFHDADDYHPQTSIDKMRNGIPLTDEDRLPWLRKLVEKIKVWESQGSAVLACSALKESYRQMLRTVPDIVWVYLDGSRETILERLQARTEHYLAPTLLDSQLEALEKPAYGIHVDISLSPERIVNEIINKLKAMAPLSAFGIIGMGVMGRSLALNLAGKNVHVSIYNRHVFGKEEGIARKILLDNPSFTNIAAFDDLQEFVQSLERPRKIMLMIMAGEAVDQQLDALMPLLDAGDVLIDGGNSFYKDTARREKLLAEKGIHFIGAGISGGEEGARKGPSIMPGGTLEGYQLVAHELNLLAAKDKDGKPCTAYIGPGGSGHFIKMVHNSIEYAEMQALAEVYHLLRSYLQLSPENIVAILQDWQKGELAGYLLEITIDILQLKEGDELLVDKILDKAEQKGTGGWSVSAALEYGVPYSSLTEAVMARALSAMKEKRVQAALLYDHSLTVSSADQEAFVFTLRNAYQSTRIINHEIGFYLMQRASEYHNWSLNLSEIARIWTNGCIIRSKLMEEISEIFKTETSILTAPAIVARMKTWQKDFAYTVAQGLQQGVALPVMSSALNYYLGYLTADSPANLIQAQRDYFGAHTYRRKDRPADEYFHTNWNAN